MATEIDGIVSSLRGATDVTQAYATVDRWNREGKTRDLLELSAALEKASDGQGAERFPYEAVADHVEEVLALTAGSDHVDAIFELLARDRVRSVQRPRPREVRVRAAASRLGYGQSKDALLAALRRSGEKKEHEEVLACWMHEVVMRGTSLDREEPAIALHERLAKRGHELGRLPLTLLASESEAPTYMPMYGANAISKAVQRLEQGPTSNRTMPPPADDDPPRATRVEDAKIEERLREAVLPWTSASNGVAEAKIFELASPIKTPPGRWLLRALPLECLAGESSRSPASGTSAGLHAERVGPDAVWGALFSAASNGGAYSSGLGAAYGRRAAWITLGALVDAPVDANAKDVDERARKASFLLFRAEGGWFNDIAWDIGTLAVRDGGKSVAVLAATDTD